MTKIESLVETLERELRATSSCSPQTCEEFAAASEDAKRPFVRALLFIGCGVSSATWGDTPVSENERIAAARLMLLKLGAQTHAPRWSSFVIEKMLDAAVSVPAGKATDIIVALCSLLVETGQVITTTTANLIKDVVVTAFRKFASHFEAGDYLAAIQRIIESTPRMHPAQAYLLLHALPEEALPAYREGILAALKGTSFFDEAERSLS